MRVVLLLIAVVAKIFSHDCIQLLLSEVKVSNLVDIGNLESLYVIC